MAAGEPINSEHVISVWGFNSDPDPFSNV